ncbi:hypothetical protein BgiMline_006239 [Biomphalaria glabrata]
METLTTFETNPACFLEARVDCFGNDLDSDDSELKVLRNGDVDDFFLSIAKALAEVARKQNISRAQQIIKFAVRQAALKRSSMCEREKEIYQAKILVQKMMIQKRDDKKRKEAIQNDTTLGFVSSLSPEKLMKAHRN